MTPKRRSFELRKEAGPFGAMVRRLRKRIGMSIRELAEQAGISNAYLSQIERGERNPPSPEQLRKLAPHLQVTVGELMEAAGYLEPQDQAPSKDLLLERAYEHVLTDPQFKYGNRLSGEITPEVKRFIVEMYEKATKRKLLPENRKDGERK